MPADDANSADCLVMPIGLPVSIYLSLISLSVSLPLSLRLYSTPSPFSLFLFLCIILPNMLFLFPLCTLSLSPSLPPSPSPSLLVLSKHGELRASAVFRALLEAWIDSLTWLQRLHCGAGPGEGSLTASCGQTTAKQD